MSLLYWIAIIALQLPYRIGFLSPSQPLTIETLEQGVKYVQS